MKQKLLFPLVCLFLLFNTGLKAQRGVLVDFNELYSMSVGEIKALLTDVPPSLVELALRNPDENAVVDAYGLLYYTIDAFDNLTLASGAVFLLKEVSPDAPLAVYMHGSITSDQEAPSRLGGVESLLGWVLGADGYIGILPDYLGLGSSPIPHHPYTHAATEASASIDMILAAQQFLLQEYGISGKKDLFLSGYSQGGHATVAVQRELEQNYHTDFNVVINVAGSGPYCLSTIQRRFMLDHPDYGRPGHIPYLVMGYKSVYPFFTTDLEDIFVEPYLSMFPGLYDRTKPIGEIEDILDVTYWTQMMNQRFLLNFKYNYFNPLNKALRNNDLVNWTPQGKLRLLYCSGDEIVSPNNTVAAWLTYLLRGAPKVLALNLGNYLHNDCAIPALAVTKILFDCNSPVHTCIFDIGLKAGGQEPHLSELSYEEALALISTEDAEVISEISPEINALTGIEENGIKSYIRVFPNPASAYIHLNFSIGSEIQRISLINNLGQTVKMYQDLGSILEFTIPCNEIAKGIYTVVVQSDQIFIERIVIE
ncbi:MAG: T9SS type A sorting domain-containing protein [Bacteroidales bacterium]|nr:T9SS type A sorting domain-containing protein [Bacteroidales bacterium]